MAERLCSLDGRRILWARTLRAFGSGFLSVVLALHLARLGLDSFEIGAMLSLTLLGSALLTIVLAARADRWGRRKALMACAGLMALSGLAFALSRRVWILAAASLAGTLSATSGDVSPFLSLDQAILPQTTVEARRTRVFAVYSLLGSFAAAAGALFAGFVAWSAERFFSGEQAVVERALFGLYSVLALANLMIFARLSPGVEAPATALDPPAGRLHSSRGVVAKLSALFALDAFAGGFVVQSTVAYWFSLRFGLGLDVLGPVFAAANVLSALSFLAADFLAARIGLIRTMVFTHLPSNILLILVPLMPDAPLAIGMLLARQMISQMDVPTRQSYVMAVVEPGERVAAAGYTNVARNLATGLSPVAAGYALNVAAWGVPFLLAGGLKIIYDLTLWFAFRRTSEQRG